ncbi:MAG: Tol-Pal system beta propeller repeat protein TolB [Proteobacteria bacterium]|nr:Tol-Pal system beta propeller repeat protein TolB [Pseudomonadota bacterium]
MRKFFAPLFFLISLFFQTLAHATVNLELTQGVDSALPIAVLPFTGQPSLYEDVTKIVSQDLQNSGQFRLVDAQNQTNLYPVNTAFWKSRGADNVVSGHIEQVGFDRYRVKFDLQDTLGNKVSAVSKEFTVPGKDFRRLAHHISDVVYKALTGEPGIFSTKIAYVFVDRAQQGKPQYRLEVADYDGHNARALLTSSEPIMSPAWSPNGKRIAYVSFESRRSQTYVVDVATGQRHLMTDYPGLNGAPAWSPDGQKLALVLSKDGSPKIYVMDVGSKQMRQVTQGGAIDTEPNWAPNGNAILFTSDRGGSPQIYEVNIGTGQTQRITYDGKYNASANYLPNGKGVAVLHGADGMYTIAIQDTASGRVDELTRTGRDESPSVSPNSKMIIYASRSGNGGVLNMISTDGRIKLSLPSREGDVREPAWSPFLG